MARIDIPEGAGGELVQVWSLSPELGGAVGNLSAAVYGERLVSPRVREVARMRIAQINGCNVCLQWRFPEMADRGVTEELYAHVEDPAERRLLGAGAARDRVRRQVRARPPLASTTRSSSRLRAAFTDAEIVELTAMIGNWLAFGRFQAVLDVAEACAWAPPAQTVPSAERRREGGCLMARVALPGDGSDLERVWSLSPDLGAAVGNLAGKVGGKGLELPWRVREAARMRIAQINGCNICMAWRVPALAKHGVDEELYAHVEDPANGDYSEQERLAIEYADKFALDHRSLDDAFFDRMKAVSSATARSSSSRCASATGSRSGA